jgi:hypothetical protein
MKFLTALTTVLVLPILSYAGDNGQYTQCRSASGRTVLEMGTVGSLRNPKTVELKIDGQSYGAAEIDEAVILTVSENGALLKFTEADHEGVDWVTVRMGPVNFNNGRSKAKILSGLDPRTGKSLGVQIDMSCRIVYNPI